MLSVHSTAQKLLGEAQSEFIDLNSMRPVNTTAFYVTEG